MHEFAIPLRRMLALRQFPVFASVDLVELAILADNVDETRVSAGTPLASLGGLHLVLEGRIEAPRGHRVETWGPRDMFGVLEALARRPAIEQAVAATDLHTLRLAATDVADVLEDNFGLLREMLRELAGRLVASRVERPPIAATFLPATPLTLVERLIVLRQLFPFVGGRLQPLAAVAQATEELCFPAGLAISSMGDLVEDTLIVLSGSLRSGARMIEQGAAIGSLESLAGLRHATGLETMTPVRVLRCANSAVLDVIEDHTDFGLAVISRFAAALLDAAPIDN